MEEDLDLIPPVDYDPFRDDEPVATEVKPGFNEEPPEPEPSKPVTDTEAPAEPASQTPARQVMSPDDIPPLDYDPFREDTPQPKKTKGGPGFTGAFSAGWGSGKESMLGVIDMARIAQLPPEQQVEEMLKIGQKPARPDDPQLLQMTDIDSPGDVWEFVKESLGQTAGSWLSASVYGGGAGAATGAGVGGAGGALAGGVGAGPGAAAGAAVGFTWGTLGAFGAMGVGGTFQELVQDEGVQKALKDGTLTPNQVMGASTAAGVAIGALDAFPAGAAFKRATGGMTKEAVKKGIKSVLIAGLKGGLEEGATEGLQSAISEATQAIAGGDIKGVERLMNVLNSAGAGAVGGAGPSAGAEVVRPGGKKPDEQTGTADPVVPEGVVEGDETGGTSSPGGTNAATPQPPAAAPAQATEDAPENITPETPGKSGVVSVVEPGTVPQDVAVALPTNSPPGEAAATPEIDEDDDLGPEIDELGEDVKQVQKATSAMQGVLGKVAAEQKAKQAIVVPAGTDEQAAMSEIGSKGPQRPEPAPSPEAQARIAQPTEQVAALATEPEPDVAPIEAIEATGEETAIPEDVQLTPTESQLQPPTEAIPESGIVAQPEPEIAPEATAGAIPTEEDADLAFLDQLMGQEAAPTPTPAASSTALAPVEERAEEAPPIPSQLPAVKEHPVATRYLADHMRTEIRRSQDETFEDPDTDAFIDKVATQFTANVPEGTSPNAIVRERLQAAIAQVRTRIEKKRREAAAAEATKIEQAHAKAQQETAKSKRAGKPSKGKEETGEKPKPKISAAMEVEHERTTIRAAKEEMKKPEAERDEHLVAIHGLLEDRKKAGKDMKPYYTGLIKEAQAKRVGKQREREAAEEAAKPKSTAVAVTEQGPSAEDAERIRTERTAKRENKVRPALKEALLDLDEFKDFRNDASGKSYIRDAARKVRDAMEKTGHKLREQLSFDKNSPEENLAIYLNEMVTNRSKHPNHDITTVWQALFLYHAHQAGDPLALAELKHLITDEAMDARGFTREHAETMAQSMFASPEDTATFRGEAEQLLLEDQSYAFNTPDVGDTVTYRPPDGGGKVEVTAREVHKGRDLLNELAGKTKRPRGLIGTLQKMFIKQLHDLVGGIDVIFVDKADMNKLAKGNDKTRGLFSGMGTVNLVRGQRPVIYIDKPFYDQASSNTQLHLIVHEMAHAATGLALKRNLHGTDQIVERMRSSLEMQLKLEGTWDLLPKDMQYGFKNSDEFIAEAFSNPDFQQLLAETKVPPDIAQEMAMFYGTHGGHAGTWWDVFLKMVHNAISKLGFGTQGVSYLEQVLKLQPTISESSEQQVEASKKTLAKQNAQRFLDYRSKRNVPEHPFDTEPMGLEIAEIADAVRTKADAAGWRSSSRKLSFKLRTTEEISRQAERILGKDNPISDLIHHFLSKRAERQRYQEEGAEITAELAEHYSKNRQDGEDLSNLIHDDTSAQVDSSVPLSHPNNSHIKGGALDINKREVHARNHARFQKLSPAAQKLYRKVAGHHTSQYNLKVSKVVRNTLRAAMKPANKGGFGVTLPQGVSEQDAIDWVMDGRIDNTPRDPQKPTKRDRTAYDDAMHAALGETAKTLQGTKAMRRIKGTYVPLMRWGKHLFTATRDIPLPAGAVRETGKPNEFLFANAKDADAFAKATDEQIESNKIEWWDPQTGQRVLKQEPGAVPIRRIVVQDKTMVMEDNLTTLGDLRQDYIDSGFKVTDIATTDSLMHPNSELLPGHINRLMNNVAQSTTGSGTVGQQAIQGAIASAYIKSLAGNRAQKRQLRRKNVQGFSKDLIMATDIANKSMAAQLANLDIAPQMAEADAAIDELLRNKRRVESQAPQNLQLARLQAMALEVRERIAGGNHGVSDGVDNFINTVSNVSFVNHLATPSYTIGNLAQSLATTYPLMAAKFGHGAATRQLLKTFWHLGVRKTLGQGLKGTVFLPKRKPNYDKQMASNFAGTPGYDKVVEKMRLRGFGASDGLEAPEVGKGGFIERVTRHARALAEAAEAVNRHGAGHAAYELARRSGMSDEAAADYAVSFVEKSQGGYAPENNPTFMQNKWLRLPMQFKKYPIMYQQAYWGAVARAIDIRNDPAERKLARKEFVNLSAMTILLAGATGLPMMEFAHGLILAAQAMGLEDDDWESWENGMQEWARKALKWAGMDGEEAAAYAEVLNRGLSRLVGFDTSSRMGNSSTILFGDPKSMDEEGMLAWFAKTALGAPGGMTIDMFKNISKGDYWNAPPWPKVIKDAIKAKRLHEEGTLDSQGDQVAKPISDLEAFWQAVGFRPTSAARQWEPGGSGTKYKEEKKVSAARVKIMSEYRHASPRDRQRIFRTTVREWNRTHRDKRERIDMSDLRKSLARQKQEQKELKESQR